MSDDPHTWPEEAHQRLRDAILEGEPHAGAPEPSEPAPEPAQALELAVPGAWLLRFPPPAGGPTNPIPPHSAERSQPMTSTPEQKRDAWVSLMSGLEVTLTTTLSHAQASEKMAQAIQDDTGHSRPGFTPPDWDATAWAAKKLLEQLRAVPAPVVPEDPALGQAVIPLSTSGEESVDNLVHGPWGNGHGSL